MNMKRCDFFKPDVRVFRVGDYVFFDKVFKVVGFKGEYLQLNDGFSEFGVHVSEVQGISLSSAFLQAQGFECVEVGDNGPATPKSNINRYEKWCCQTEWVTLDVFFDRITNRFSMDGVVMPSVHDFQHVLWDKHKMEVESYD